MKCDKCGREFPSQYYLDFNSVPGMQFCSDCVHALSPQELAGLRARSGISRRPSGLASNEFVFPNNCCSCLGPADTKMTVSSSHREGNLTRTLSIQVPVCLACSKREKLLVYFVGGGIGLGAVIGLLAGGGGGLIVGGIVGFFAGALVGYVAGKFAEPASIDRDGRVSFRNPKYDALFRAANSRF